MSGMLSDTVYRAAGRSWVGTKPELEFNELFYIGLFCRS